MKNEQIKLNKLNTTTNTANKGERKMTNVKRIKNELNAIYSDYKAQYRTTELFEELKHVATKWNLYDYVEEFNYFVDDDTIEFIIKDELENGNWTIVDLAQFIRNVNFFVDNVYYLYYEELRNVNVAELEDLKNAIIKAAEDRSEEIEKLKYYQIRKEELRNEAIEWQVYQDPISWGGVYIAGNYFLTEGRKYGLLKEFRNEGII